MERYNRAIRKFERETIRNRINELGLTDGFDVGCGNNIIAGIGIDNDVDSKARSFMDMDEKFTDDNVAEFIICCHSLEHTNMVIPSLQNFYNILKKGGKLFICAPDGNWVSSKDLGDGDMNHRQVFTIMTLTKLVEFCGFKIDTCNLIEKNSLFLEATK